MYDEALNEYETALSLKPDYSPAYNNMGHVYMERGEIDKAIELERRAVMNDFIGAAQVMVDLSRDVQIELSRCVDCED